MPEVIILWRHSGHWKCILPFEVILEKAQQYRIVFVLISSSLKQMSDSNY
jgi:hypothetical protein